MRYQGGKSKIAAHIANAIMSRVGGARASDLVSLFCGACSVEANLAPYFERVTCNDIHPYLIAMLNGAKNGYNFPDHVSEQQYRYIKDFQDEDPCLTGFIGIGCSFGGKWFGGYARNIKREENFALEAKHSLKKTIDALENAVFTCKDYREVFLPSGCIVYADPPYKDTTQYGGSRFDSDAFWEYMRSVSNEHLVFISELQAPDDFAEVWHRPVRREIDANTQNRFTVNEKLYVHRCNL